MTCGADQRGIDVSHTVGPAGICVSHTAGPAWIRVSHTIGPAGIRVSRPAGRRGGICVERFAGRPGVWVVIRDSGTRLARRAEFLMGGSFRVIRGFLLVSDDFRFVNSLV